MTEHTAPFNLTASLVVGTDPFPFHHIAQVETVDEAVRLIRSGEQAQVPNVATARRVLEGLGVDPDQIERLVGRIRPETATPKAPRRIHTAINADASAEEMSDFVAQVREAAFAVRAAK